MPLLENIKQFKKKAVDLYDTGEAMGKKYFGKNPKYKGPRGTYEDLYGKQPVHAKKKTKTMKRKKRITKRSRDPIMNSRPYRYLADQERKGAFKKIPQLDTIFPKAEAALGRVIDPKVNRIRDRIERKK